MHESYLFAAVHLNGVPFGNKEPAAFTSRHPPESGELVDSDSDPDPTPMASLQPGSLDETVVPEEEQGKGLSGLAVSSGRAGGVPSSDTDSSYETGEPTSTASSRYHSLQNISAINFGELEATTKLICGCCHLTYYWYLLLCLLHLLPSKPISNVCLLHLREAWGRAHIPIPTLWRYPSNTAWNSTFLPSMYMYIAASWGSPMGVNINEKVCRHIFTFSVILKWIC